MRQPQEDNNIALPILRKITDIINKDYITKKDIDDLSKDIGFLIDSQKLRRRELRELAETFIDSISTFEYSLNYPSNFQKNLGIFNNSIRNKSKGLIAGRLLQATGGHGDRSGIYRANISKVILRENCNYMKNIDRSGLFENRLLQLEDDIRKIKNHLGLS